MKHCVCVIEESVLAVGFHNFYVYVKTPPRANDLPVLPDFINAAMTCKLVDEQLQKAGYLPVSAAIPGQESTVVPSLADFVLNEFWAVDFLFYDPQGKYIRRQVYEMQLGYTLKDHTDTTVEKVSS